MYDINTKNIRKTNTFHLLTLLVGLISFIIFSYIVFLNYKKQYNLDSKTLSTKIEVNATYDDEGSLMYSPIYYYEVNGKNYTCHSNSSSSLNPGTKNKNVYYDSKNPSNCLTEFSKTTNNFLIIFVIIPLIIIVVEIINLKKVRKRLKIINELNKSGKLIKNLTYNLESTNLKVNGVDVERPVVLYTLPSMETITLHGDAIKDNKVIDDIGLIDLVIDENNPNNYFLDFNINRISGNLQTDYYSNEEEKNKEKI